MYWRGRAIFAGTGLLLLIGAFTVLPNVSEWLAWVSGFLAAACFMIAVTREQPNG